MAETPSELQTEIEKLEARHAEHPEGRFFVPLANAYRKSGEIGRAESVLRDGLRRHPDYLSAHIVLGRCLADRGAAGEAVAEFEHVLGIDPQNLIALRTLGELAMSSGRTDESVRWYEQLLAVDPMNEEARRALDSLAEPTPEPEPDTDWWGAAAVGPSSEPMSEPPADSAALPARTATPYSAEDGDPQLEAASGEITSEVVTETIAELYARQGLVDRAIEVYRELIRRRGGDPALELRIAELLAPPAVAEAPAAAEFTAAPDLQAPDEFEPELAAWERSALAPEGAPGGEAPVASEAPLPFDEPLPVLGEAAALPETIDDMALVDADPFASSFEYGFLDEEPSPAGAPSEPAGTTGRTIADYLGELAAWQPGAAAEPFDVAALELLDAPFAEPADAPWLEPFEPPLAAEPIAAELEPGMDLLADLEAETAEPDGGIVDPWVDAIAAGDGAETEAEPADPWVGAASETETAAAGAPAPGASLDDGLSFPWETPVEAGPPETSAVPVSSDAEEDEPFPFESFFKEAAAAEESAAELASRPAAADPAPGSAPAPAASDEEDDLESFQAWLRSLKR